MDICCQVSIYVPTVSSRHGCELCYPTMELTTMKNKFFQSYMNHSGSKEKHYSNTVSSSSLFNVYTVCTNFKFIAHHHTSALFEACHLPHMHVISLIDRFTKWNFSMQWVSGYYPKFWHTSSVVQSNALQFSKQFFIMHFLTFAN